MLLADNDFFDDILAMLFCFKLGLSFGLNGFRDPAAFGSAPSLGFRLGALDRRPFVYWA